MTATYVARHRRVAQPRPMLPACVVRPIAGDPLARGAVLLLANTIVLSACGFVFWTVAARIYSPTAVGAFSGVTSAITLLGVIAAVGVPNMITRHLRASGQQRRLIWTSLGTVAGIGGVLALGAAWLLNSLAPDRFGVDADAVWLVVIVLVVLNSASTATDAGLVALRAHRSLLLKSTLGGVAKVALLPLVASLGTMGLLVAQGSGAVLSAAVGLAALLSRSDRGPRRAVGSTRVALGWRRFAAGNYVGTLFGIVPSTVVPLLILTNDGATEAAWFAVAALLAGFLNFLPSVTAQVLFAEAGWGHEPFSQFGRAAKGVYGLLLPAVVILMIGAPYLLAIFGAGYTSNAAGCLRVLAAATLFSATSYLSDATMIAAGRVGWYAALNATNALFVVAGVTLALGHGVTAIAVGWLIAQALSAALGVVALRWVRVAMRIPAAPRPSNGVIRL
ncbi:lipopolysaccharide biosynthesis protein [Micromonospora psammae]|uniref:lipopolysaccharide biosynthesis protein n=1 Tax=Micromonospora sp. CPCC 205556 TaxID=3122398 RepID=UPI002FF18252